MTGRQKLDAQELKERLIAERGFRCEVCGNAVSYQTAQLAHRTPATRFYLKKYGKAVIHHPLNLAVVCSLKCNSAVLSNPSTHPVEATERLERIREDLG